MYEEDSFFTLSGPEQVGLAFLSTVLALLTLFLIWKLARGHRWWVRLLMGVLVFFLFVWLSPQVYYSYYLMIIDTLPVQIVIQPPPDPLYLGRLLLFIDRANLSHHSQGLLGWAIIAVALFLPRPTSRARR